MKNGVHSQDIDAAKHLETDSSGHIRISGLIHGDYVLKEIETQSGYQIGQAETAVTIEKSKTVTVTIENKKFRHLKCHLEEVLFPKQVSNRQWHL